MTALDALAHELEVVFPVHPRTAKALGDNGARWSRMRILPPAGPLDFLAMQRYAAGVLTDSGGVQEETTFLGVPCFTLRDNTERPVTLSHGTNRLLGLSPERIFEIPQLLNDGGGAARHAMQLFGWDGRASERIAQVLNASAERRGRSRRRTAGKLPFDGTADAEGEPHERHRTDLPPRAWGR
jgi:UDP-N-acetylglucosamine 2-epimerase (non-hydrolysing)